MTEEGLADVIRTHITRYPEAEVIDMYKLLHQATFGVGHLIANKKTSRELIELRMKQLRPLPGAPLLENIHPAGAIVRLHLQPYMALGGGAKDLVNAMAESAAAVELDPVLMAARWRAFEGLCQPGGPFVDVFSAQDVMLLGRIRSREQWPAVHHSPAYYNAYHPHYRVLTREAAEALVEKLNVAYETI